MASRVEPWDGLDFFPTPPWATRALMEFVIAAIDPFAADKRSVWEPACGAGHMADVLSDYFPVVHASDVHDYGYGFEVGSFVGCGPDVAVCPFDPDWIITNPPFNLAKQFALRAFDVARKGVALLVRTSWLEGGERYRELFDCYPPEVVGLFSERVPMHKGRWDPRGSTATSYAWVVWRLPFASETKLVWIPPGQRQALHYPGDEKHFAGRIAGGVTQ